MLAVVGGLNHFAIRRLSQTWSKTDKPLKEVGNLWRRERERGGERGGGEREGGGGGLVPRLSPQKQGGGESLGTRLGGGRVGGREGEGIEGGKGDGKNSGKERGRGRGEGKEGDTGDLLYVVISIIPVVGTVLPVVVF